MTYKLASLELQESIDHEKKFGKFNDAPDLWREIFEKEFAQSKFFSYTPEKIEFRQIHIKGIKSKNDKMIEAHMFHFHDGTGVALSNDFWKGKVSYFAFGCNHDFEEKPRAGLFNCQHYLVCKKCGYGHITDSSD